MSNSGQSTTFNYFVGSGLVQTNPAKTTADLVPLQIGLFNSKNYKALASPTSAKVVPEIIIAMGSPNKETIAWTNAANSFKSVPIRASKLISWRKSLPKKALNHKVAIGWDGTSDCKTITALCDEVYTLHIQVEGSPSSRYFGEKPLSQTFVVDTGCCTDCVSGCEASEEALVDNFIKQINSSKLISPFVKAEKLVSYTEDPTTETVDYESYTLQVPDAGGIEELAKIQATYPDATVTLQSRNGIYSTYLLIQLESASAPSDYTVQAGAVIPNCTTCPSGYTLVPAKYRYKIQRQDAGTAGNLATVKTDYSDTTAVRLSYVNGESTYLIHTSSATAPSAAATGDIVTGAGVDGAYCSLSSPTTYTWAASDAYYKSVRELCLVLGDDLCDNVSGTSQIAAITAFYSGNPKIVAGSLAQDDNGTCANTYTIKQVSDNLMKTSDCATEIPIFSVLDPYKGAIWTTCCDDTSTAGTVDKIGIVLTGAYTPTQFSDPAFKFDDFVELDLPRIIVRQGEFVELENKCSTRWAVTQLQAPQYPTGIGQNVLKEYIAIQSTKGQRWSDDIRWREIYGYNYDFIKKNKYYKHYYLEFEALDKFFTATGFGGNDFKQTIVFAFEEDVNTTAFETLIESWINSERPDLIDSDTQDNLYR